MGCSLTPIKTATDLELVFSLPVRSALLLGIDASALLAGLPSML